MQQHGLALADFEQVIAINRDDLRAKIYRAGAIITLGGRDQEAHAELLSAINSPGFMSIGFYDQFLAYMLDGQLKTKSKDHQNAVMSLNEAIKIYNLHQDVFQRHQNQTISRIVFHCRALANFNLLKFSQSAQDMQQSILLTIQVKGQALPRDYQMLAMAYYMAEEYDKCVEVLPYVTPEGKRELGETLGDRDFFLQ